MLVCREIPKEENCVSSWKPQLRLKNFHKDFTAFTALAVWKVQLSETQKGTGWTVPHLCLHSQVLTHLHMDLPMLFPATVLCKWETHFVSSQRPPWRIELWGKGSEALTSSPLCVGFFHKTLLDKILSAQVEIFLADLTLPRTYLILAH